MKGNIITKFLYKIGLMKRKFVDARLIKTNINDVAIVREIYSYYWKL